MFDKKKKEKKGAVANATQFTIRTMADDIAQVPMKETISAHGNTSTTDTQEKGPSPFLQEVEKTAVPTQKNATQQHDSRASQKTMSSVESVQSRTIHKERSHSSFVTWILGILFVLIVAVTVWFVLRAGLMTGIFGSDDVSIAGLREEVSQDSSSGDQGDVPAQEITTVLSVAPYEYSDMLFMSADGALDILTQATPMDILAKIKEVINTTNKPFNEPIILDVLVDGAPISFGVFAQRFLPSMPVDVLTGMNRPFQIYILPQGGEKRIGIHTYTTEPDATRTALRKNEALLVKAFSPLYLFAQQSPSNVLFEDSAHSGVPIRFYNFAPDATQSIDYAIHYDHVFFGTSRPTMRMMMDAVFLHGAQKEASMKSAGEMTNNTVSDSADVGSSASVDSSSQMGAPPAGAPADWRP